MGKWKQVQQYAEHIPSPLENYRRNRHLASHILLLDATYTKIRGEDRAIIIAFDTGIGVIDYWIDESENNTAYFALFNRLSNIGYQPICVVSDGHSSIAKVVEEYGFPHQRCVFHILREIERGLKRKGILELEGRNLVLYQRLKWVIMTPDIEHLSKRIDSLRLSSDVLFRRHKRLIKWFWGVLPNAVMHLSFFEKVPNSTSLLENLNGQIKARFKTMRGLKSEESLNNLLKILFYFRNYK